METKRKHLCHENAARAASRALLPAPTLFCWSGNLIALRLGALSGQGAELEKWLFAHTRRYIYVLDRFLSLK